MTLCNTIWEQSDDGVRAGLKNHKDFKQACVDNSIINIMKILKEISTNGDFGDIHDTIYWSIHQNWKLTNYTQI